MVTWVWGWASLHMLIPLSGVSILAPLLWMPITTLECFFLRALPLCWYQSQFTDLEPHEWSHKMTTITWDSCIAQEVFAGSKHTQGVEGECADEKGDKVEFERKRIEIFSGWRNHSEIGHIHVFLQKTKSHGAGSRLTEMRVWFEVC